MTKNIATGCLKVRKDPTSGNVLSYIFKNDIFEMLEKSADGRWLKVLTTAGQEGWIAVSRWFKPVPQEDIAKSENPPWLKVALDECKKNVEEIPGPEANDRILKYLESTTLPPDYKSKDDTDWCAAFVNWCFEECGITVKGFYAAKSWLDWGDRISTPRRGCVTVFRRGKGYTGHVGFYIGEGPGKRTIAVLGGNQDNKINIKPYLRKNLLGFCWPREEDYPDNQ
jgi:uncharacterized protein (TIGR02594 family)